MKEMRIKKYISDIIMAISVKKAYNTFRGATIAVAPRKLSGYSCINKNETHMIKRY